MPSGAVYWQALGGIWNNGAEKLYSLLVQLPPVYRCEVSTYDTRFGLIWRYEGHALITGALVDPSLACHSCTLPKTALIRVSHLPECPAPGQA